MMDAVNQWLGDTMILQMLCDSEHVNEQEREVLQRWILAAEKPEDDDPGIEVAEWVERCRHPEKCIRPQCGDFCCEPEPPQLTPEQEAVAKRAWAMAHEIMWEGTNLRIEDIERATLRGNPLSTGEQGAGLHQELPVPPQPETTLTSTSYCLACQKPGHRTDECHATHALNTPAARELFRLVRIATEQNAPE